MKKKLIILANSEKLCAYRMISQNLPPHQHHIEKIETHRHHLSPDPADITDDDGRFPSGGLPHGAPMRHGEAHGRSLEKKKRLLDEMASAICDIIAHEEFDIWNLATPAELSLQLLKRLPMQVQVKLTRLKKADYTGLPTKQIEHLFA
ncbi:MAG: host attachment protein [Verrucomicrobiae bacterium]|nr:host attachment protein [Verrucomicrobiae bacterium]NNJ43821.1 hypothetical protein [Akkermansiaceae bacterium]